jgi:catechol 2,3-dioxygenase-like lactoylglutathione lyase family enzyme
VKTEGIDHVAILVKDIDRAVEFLSKLLGIEFQEIISASERLGMRLSISLDRQIELLSVVDPIKAARTPPPFREIAEFAEREREGLIRLFLRVKDADEAAADAERKGVRVAHKVEEKQLGTVVPHFKEVVFDEKDIPVKRIGLIAYL